MPGFRECNYMQTPHMPTSILTSPPKGIIGLPLSLLVALITTLLAILVLVPYFEKVKTAAESTSQIEACQQSIQLFSTITSKTLGTFSPVIKCPAPHIDIPDKDEKLKQDLAEQVSTCWQKTNGRNNRVTSAEEPIRALIGLDSGDSLCILCSSFTVPSALAVKDLVEYMNTHNKLHTAQTYADYVDTSWYEASTDSISHIFLRFSKPGAIPLPNQHTEQTAEAEEMSILEPGTTYYILDYNQLEQHTVVVASQAESPNLVCTKFIQQRAPGSVFSVPRYA